MNYKLLILCLWAGLNFSTQCAQRQEEMNREIAAPVIITLAEPSDIADFNENSYKILRNELKNQVPSYYTGSLVILDKRIRWINITENLMFYEAFKQALNTPGLKNEIAGSFSNSTLVQKVVVEPIKLTFVGHYGVNVENRNLSLSLENLKTKIVKDFMKEHTRGNTSPFMHATRVELSVAFKND